jgi:hypothetical protein
MGKTQTLTKLTFKQQSLMDLKAWKKYNMHPSPLAWCFEKYAFFCTVFQNSHISLLTRIHLFQPIHKCICEAVPDKQYISVQPDCNFLLKSPNMVHMPLAHTPLPALNFSCRCRWWQLQFSHGVQGQEVQDKQSKGILDCLTLNMTALWNIRNYSPNDKTSHPRKVASSHHMAVL